MIALFKENEQFKQTRGLIELVSRLLRSVWERKANDVFLIGPQHFDLSIQEVRDKLTEISGMRDVIAKDLWDGNQSAQAQIIDLNMGKEAAAQVGSLLLTASLSTAVNAVKGLTARGRSPNFTKCTGSARSDDLGTQIVADRVLGGDGQLFGRVVVSTE